MDAIVTRDDVCNEGDRTSVRLTLPEAWTVNNMVELLWSSAQLPTIGGGHATWALSSNIPLAVAAQEWARPKFLPMIDYQLKQMDISNNVVRLHWSYFAQMDPNTVYDVLRRLRLRAHPL